MADKLKHAKYFAGFDTSKVFFHIPLDQESKLLTAMLTPFGIDVYNVLAMGLSNATDLFKTCNHEVLQGLNGCTNITDDVLVYGTTYDEFKSNVISFLDHCIEEDMHLNPDQVKIDCPEVPFFGNVLSKDGLSPDNTKVQLIKDWLVPLCVPLQALLKKDTEFIWTSVHQHASDQIKLHVFNDVKLQFYDSSKPLHIEVDTSKKGIGAVMLQQDKIVPNMAKSDEIPMNLRPISYASKTLLSTESNYLNIEHELFSLLFAVTHFKHFTFG